MLEPFSDHTQGQRLNLGDCFVTILPITHDARQCRNLGQPSTVFFALELDSERHDGNVARIGPDGAVRWRDMSFESPDGPYDDAGHHAFDAGAVLGVVQGSSLRFDRARARPSGLDDACAQHVSGSYSVSRGSTRFYDFDEFERLVAAARALDGRAYLLVLMAGEAGLRLGEMVALEWSDIDFVKRQLCVQ